MLDSRLSDLGPSPDQGGEGRRGGGGGGGGGWEKVIALGFWPRYFFLTLPV